jgi:hypothetical protein
MNTPIDIVANNLPQDVKNIIQNYCKNELMYNALREYFDYLYEKKEIYENFIYEHYVKPNCSCIGTRQCSECWLFHDTLHYMPEDFKLCIWDNPQFKKIYYNK